MFIITYKNGWVQAENHNAAVGFYTKDPTKYFVEKLWKLVYNEPLINEPDIYNTIIEWHRKFMDNKKSKEFFIDKAKKIHERNENLKMLEYIKAKNIWEKRGYKTIIEINKWELYTPLKINVQQICPNCGTLMEVDKKISYTLLHSHSDPCMIPKNNGKKYKCYECGNVISEVQNL